MPFDYSVHYSNWHDDTIEHADIMASAMWAEFNKWAPVEKSQPILDIGCGYGFLIRAFEQAHYTNVIGIDTSEDQARVARSHGHKVETVDDTVGWLIAHPNSFKLITLTDVLEHIPPQQHLALLEAIHAALLPDGYVIVKVPNANAILSARWRYIDWTHHTSFTEHSLQFVLKCSGFRDVSVTSEKGIGRLPRRLWRRSAWVALRKIIVRWVWLQVYKSELPRENIDNISFDLNIIAVAKAR